MIANYTGFTVRCEDGQSEVSTLATDGLVELCIEVEGTAGIAVRLTPDEAVRVATCLLRDRNLIVNGAG